MVNIKRDTIEDVIAWLQTYPHFGGLENIVPMAFDPQMQFDSNALAYTGQSTPEKSTDIIDRLVETTKQANYILYLRRFINSPDLRAIIANFIQDFENWVEEEDVKRGTTQENPLLPQFSDTDYERIWADNGMFLSTTENADINDFMVQIHIQFQKNYDKKELF